MGHGIRQSTSLSTKLSSCITYMIFPVLFTKLSKLLGWEKWVSLSLIISYPSYSSVNKQPMGHPSWLVVSTPLKILVNWDLGMTIPNIGENKTCPKPPTSKRFFLEVTQISGQPLCTVLLRKRMPKAFAWRSETSMPKGNFNIFLTVCLKVWVPSGND